LLRFKMAINDDWPLNKLSVPTIRVNKELYGKYSNDEDAVKYPICANIIFNPIDFINVNLPEELILKKI
jgi:hypothetical protein